MKDWAIILGASSGIGKSCALKLAEKGINIIGIYLRRPKKEVEVLESDLKSYGVKVILKKMSATNIQKRHELIEELKLMGDIRIKIFIHSLAFGALKSFINSNPKDVISQKQVEMTLDVMSNSIIYWCQELYFANLLKKGSQIFGMTSSGSNRQWKSYGAVSMAKSALESACRQLALEFAPHGIASNAIMAGVTDTPALRKIPGNEDMIRQAIIKNPHGRLTTPQDIGDAVAMIGLSESTWMTGNSIRVDGGEDISG
ncbi:MAG: SDR family oxidoreductase [Candidatus Neomarinimicrobiota bacterium]|jgi:NAD(P)-dependent dehydrogenase (short-subunit alcohol dehydrogenase family)|nr:SDR family oxidoreductase [Candidatus Neomarinimicrobiota bacterium]